MEFVFSKIVNGMPTAILLIIFMIIGAFFTQIIILTPFDFLDLFNIPNWLFLTLSVICLSWFLAE